MAPPAPAPAVSEADPLAMQALSRDLMQAAYTQLAAVQPVMVANLRPPPRSVAEPPEHRTTLTPSTGFDRQREIAELDDL